MFNDCISLRNISSPAVLYPYSLINSLLYFHRPASVVSLASRASATHLPAMAPATKAGPIPPASSGLGIHAESPTSRKPPATRQSFCLLTDTWKLPVALLASSGSVESRGLLMALFRWTYSSIRVETVSFLCILLLRPPGASFRRLGLCSPCPPLWERPSRTRRGRCPDPGV